MPLNCPFQIPVVMNLAEFKIALKDLVHPLIYLPSGVAIPAHFHVTELALVSKHFIDCGGVSRLQRKITFQLWVANDTAHRLSSLKWQGIIKKGELDFGFSHEEIEIEYQGNTIERYGLSKVTDGFKLVPLFTECLAPDHCGIPDEQLPTNACCKPNRSCC
jgi:hypothetical protein